MIGAGDAGGVESRMAHATARDQRAPRQTGRPRRTLIRRVKNRPADRWFPQAGCAEHGCLRPIQPFVERCHDDAWILMIIRLQMKFLLLRRCGRPFCSALACGSAQSFAGRK
jgi:hypothetical protein